MRSLNILNLERHDGVVLSLELPDWLDEEDHQTDDSRFRRAAAFVQEEYFHRRQGWRDARTREALLLTEADKATQVEVRRTIRVRQIRTRSPNVWLVGTCYQIITACIEWADEAGADIGEIATFFRRNIGDAARRLEKQGGAERELDGCLIFQLGLNALFEPIEFEHDPKNNKKRPKFAGVLSRSDRELFAKQMYHAYRHYVPYAFLEGFLLQCRNSGLPARAAAREIEEGFEYWVAVNRHWDQSAGELRDSCKPKIGKRARKFGRPKNGHPFSSRAQRQACS